MTSILLSTPAFISRPSRSRESRILKIRVTAKVSNFRPKLKVTKNDRWSVAEKNEFAPCYAWVCLWFCSRKNFRSKLYRTTKR